MLKYKFQKARKLLALGLFVCLFFTACKGTATNTIEIKNSTSALELISSNRNFAYEEAQAFAVKVGDSKFKVTQNIKPALQPGEKRALVKLTTQSSDTVSSRIMNKVIADGDSLLFALNDQTFALHFDNQKEKPFDLKQVNTTAEIKTCLKDYAPKVTGETLDDTDITVIQNGKYLLLDFWASYCGPCIEEMYFYKELLQEHRDKLEIVSVSLDKKAKGIVAAKKQVEEAGFNWNQLKLSSDLSDHFCGPSLNNAFLYSPKGELMRVGIKSEQIAHLIK